MGNERLFLAGIWVFIGEFTNSASLGRKRGTGPKSTFRSPKSVPQCPLPHFTFNQKWCAGDFGFALQMRSEVETMGLMLRSPICKV